MLFGIAALAAGVVAVCPAQFVNPEQGKSGGQTHQNDRIGCAHGSFHTVAVVFVCHPLLHLFLGFFDSFLVHAGMTPPGGPVLNNL